MQCMHGRMPVAVAGSSVLLCVATLALWVRSYRTADVYRFGYWNARPYPTWPAYRTADMLVLGSCDGCLLLRIGSAGCCGPTLHPTGPGPDGQRCDRIADLDHSETWQACFQSHGRQWKNLFGIQYGTEFLVRGQQLPRRSLLVPDAIPFALSAIAPWLCLLRSRRPIRSGLCASCGYDLRATPHRCPECGTLVAEKIGSRMRASCDRSNPCWQS